MMELKNIFMRYKSSLILFIALILIYYVNKEIGGVAIKGTIDNIWEFIKLVPPVFIILGLMDVWVPKEKMIKLMGEGSGGTGIILAFIIGSFAAGPLYAAFPIGAMLLRKGSSIRNVMIFIGAWAACKIPMLLIEVSSLGLVFTMTRLSVEIIGIVFVAYIIEKVLPGYEKELIYKRAEKL